MIRTILLLLSSITNITFIMYLSQTILKSWKKKVFLKLLILLSSISSTTSTFIIYRSQTILKVWKRKKVFLVIGTVICLSPISGCADITDIRIPAWAPLSNIRFISLLQTTCSQLVTILLKNITKKNKNLSSNFLLGIWRHKFKVGQEKLLVHTLRFVMCHQIAVENVIWYATKFKQSISI